MGGYESFRLDGADLAAGQDELLREARWRLPEGRGHVVSIARWYCTRGVPWLRARCRLLSVVRACREGNGHGALQILAFAAPWRMALFRLHPNYCGDASPPWLNMRTQEGAEGEIVS